MNKYKQISNRIIGVVLRINEDAQQADLLKVEQEETGTIELWPVIEGIILPIQN